MVLVFIAEATTALWANPHVFADLFAKIAIIAEILLYLRLI